MKARLTTLLFVVCAIISVVPAYAWTTPVAVSNTSINASNSKIVKGANGAVHVVYYNANWRICYRYRNAYGVFGPIETFGDLLSFRPDVIEDSAGRPHVIYPAEVTKTNTELFEAVKDNGVWTVTRLTYTEGVMEDEPKLGLDSSGRIHMIFTRGNDVMHRVSTNGTWSSETWVGTTENSYYQRPDLSIDPSDNLHVVYGDSKHVYYRKCTSGVWGTVRSIMTAPGFEAFAKVAGTTSNKVVAIAFIQEPSGHLEFTYSNDGGNTWNIQQYLAPGHWPNIDKDDQGNAYVAFTDLGYNNSAAYMKWNGTFWTPSVDVAPTGNWQGWVDIACGTNGIISMVWDEAASPTRINLSSSAPPSDPTSPSSPAPVIDDGSVQIISTYLHARWSASSDPETGIARYEYSIGTTAGSTNITGWTSVGLALEVTKTGIFAPGTYYFNVRVVNGAGQYSSITSSDGIQIQSNGNPFEFVTPTTVSSSAYSCDNAMLAKASDGGVHLVFQNAMNSNYSNAKVVYRKKSSGVMWGSLEDVTTGSPTGMYPDVVEDAGGLVHVVFGNSLARESMDIFDRVKSGSSWLSTVNLTNNNVMCWYPRVAANASSVYLLVNSGYHYI